MPHHNYQIFISYAAGDVWNARRVAENIKSQCHAEVFLDVLDIYAGEEIECTIFTALRKCDELWVLLTPSVVPIYGSKPPKKSCPPILGSLDRRFVWMEVGAARVRGIPIIGLVKLMTINQLLAIENVPLYLKRGKLVDMNDAAAYDALLKEARGRAAGRWGGARKP